MSRFEVLLIFKKRREGKAGGGNWCLVDIALLIGLLSLLQVKDVLKAFPCSWIWGMMEFFFTVKNESPVREVRLRV